MSTTLKDTFKPTASKKSKSSKTPQFYNAEKSRCIEGMAFHPNAIVRSALAENVHTPAKVLASMLDVEEDKQVLRCVLMNNRLARKAVQKFVNDSEDRRVEWYEDDTELIAHFAPATVDEE